jgi:hypothetical protein
LTTAYTYHCASVQCARPRETLRVPALGFRECPPGSRPESPFLAGVFIRAESSAACQNPGAGETVERKSARRVPDSRQHRLAFEQHLHGSSTTWTAPPRQTNGRTSSHSPRAPTANSAIRSPAQRLRWPLYRPTQDFGPAGRIHSDIRFAKGYDPLALPSEMLLTPETTFSIQPPATELVPEASKDGASLR